MNNVTLDAGPTYPKFEEPITARPHRLHLLVENRTVSLQLDWGLIYVMTMSFIYLLCLSFVFTEINKMRIVLHSIAVSCVACATDNTELWLTPFAKQRRNPCSQTLTSVPGFEYAP